MRKKSVLAVLLAVVMIFAFAGCGEDEKEADKSKEKAASEESKEESGSDKDSDKDSESNLKGDGTLVVFFSRTGEQYEVGKIDKGNTAIVADMIADKTKADKFEVVPEKDYPYTYEKLTEIAKKEQEDKERPKYKGDLPDFSKYKTVFIGAPVWWGDWPMIMYTFFEDNSEALSGKTLIPFSTHAGSGLSGFDTKLESKFSDSKVGEGLAISGEDAQNNQDAVKSEVEKWLKKAGY